MTVGARFFNPNTGNLIIDSEAVNYKYLGQPTLVSAGAKSAFNYSGVWGGNITEYVYEITLPNATMQPLVGVKARNDAIVAVSYVWQHSGAVWRMSIFSVLLSGALDLGTLNVVTPTVYVFCPYSNTDAPTTGDAAMVMRNSAGNVSFCTKQKPLWIKQALPLTSKETGSTQYAYGYGWQPAPSSVYYNGYSVAWSAIANPILINAPLAGQAIGTFFGSGNEIFTLYYGWVYAGNAMKIMPFIIQHATRNEGNLDYLDWEVGTGFLMAFVVDGALL